MQASGFIEVQICYLFRCNYSCNFQKGDTVCSHKQNGLHPGRGQEISCFSQISKQSARLNKPERTPHSCGTKYHICGKTAVCQNTFWRRNKSSISMLREDTDFREKKKKIKATNLCGKDVREQCFNWLKNYLQDFVSNLLLSKLLVFVSLFELSN